MALFWLLALQCFIALFSKAHAMPQKNIVSGQKIKIFDAPYQALLSPMYCGGSIVSTNHILTAAQCFKDKPEADDVKVGVGADTRDDLQYFEVKAYKVHPRYDPKSLNDYDVAVITLKKTLKFSDKIKAVPIVKFHEHKKNSGIIDDLIQDLFHHTRVTGWGDTAVGIHSPSKHLMKADGIEIQWNLCKTLYKIFDKDLSDRMMCAADIIDGGDRCVGDSGAPLISLDTREQVGIASWGDSCGKRLHPGVYTNLADVSVASFVQEQLKKH